VVFPPIFIRKVSNIDFLALFPTPFWHCPKRCSPKSQGGTHKRAKHLLAALGKPRKVNALIVAEAIRHDLGIAGSVQKLPATRSMQTFW
jgi:hypothetical protein